MRDARRDSEGNIVKDTGMAKVMEALLARLRRAEAEIVLLRRENERLMRELSRKKTV